MPPVRHALFVGLASFTLALAAGCSSSDSAAPGGSGGAGGQGGGSAGQGGGSDAAVDSPSDVQVDVPTEGSGGSGGSTDAGSDADAAAGPWACLGHVTLPPPSTTTVVLTIQFSDFVTQSKLAGVNVVACARTDAACAAPLASTVSDSSGLVSLTLPAGANGFDGFLDLSGGGVYPTIIFSSNPVSKDLGYGFLLVTQAEIPLLAAQLVAIDPTRGSVVATMADCTQNQAAGVSLAASTADGSSASFYLSNSAPSASATETDGTGLAGILNVGTGTVTLTGTVAATSQTMGTTDVLVRADTLTTVVFTPTP